MVAAYTNKRKEDEGFNQWNAAAQVMPGVWQTAVTDIVWSVKWGMEGLQVVRPYIVFMEDITLPAGKGFMLGVKA